MMLTVFSASNGMTVRASEKNPAFLITDEYVVIDYVKYDLVNNKIVYNGLEYELIDGALIAYDANGTPNLIVLPVE